MKKKIFICFVFFLLSLQIFCLFTTRALAASPLPPASTGTGAPPATTTTVTPPPGGGPAEGDWIPDADVTFQGKTAARSLSFFNWVLANYKWSYGDQPLIEFWVRIRNIVFGILLLVVLSAAFVIIVSGGKSLTAVLFTRKFILILLLIMFSFAIVRFLYQIIDIIQGFFIHNPEGAVISSKDLLNMSFDYQEFLGFRRFGPTYDEAAFISLLMVKLTAVTYYVMASILLLRKVILWFFIAVSPIFPLLTIYFPIRNTAKIWIGEFFRWLLYAPLFTIFLSSLVTLWRNNILILPFNFPANANKPVIYPTSINILLGGPGQQLALNNSINYNDTFIQYVLALIMLWVVIFLPFILLQIFLDYLSKIAIDKNSPAWGYIANVANKIPGKDFIFSNKLPWPSNPQPPVGYQPTGVARPLPTGVARTVTTATTNVATQSKINEINRAVNTANTASNVSSNVNQVSRTVASQTNQGVKNYTSNQSSAFTTHVGQNYQTNQTTNVHQSVVPSQQFARMVQHAASLKPVAANRESLRLINFPIPTMRDIVRYETARISTKQVQHAEIAKVHETLEKIARPDIVSSIAEREQYNLIKTKLSEAKLKGDPVATSILSAANTVAKPTDASGQPATPAPAFPIVNQIQTVSLDDYEAVKTLWQENYQSIDIPALADKPERTRKEWIEDDIKKISETISLLTSNEPEKIKEGMMSVSSILPFLLIGGFSQTEVVAYLKAKSAAGKTVLKDLEKEEQKDETLLEAKKATAKAAKEATAEEAIPLEEEKNL